MTLGIRGRHWQRSTTNWLRSRNELAGQINKQDRTLSTRVTNLIMLALVAESETPGVAGWWRLSER